MEAVRGGPLRTAQGKPGGALPLPQVLHSRDLTERALVCKANGLGFSAESIRPNRLGKHDGLVS